MPWSSGAAFAAAHNKKLNGAAADKAREMAEAMIRRGVPEGTAIATANRHGNALQAESERDGRAERRYRKQTPA